MHHDEMTGRIRREVACGECGEVREMAAHGLCYTCYRRSERERKRREERLITREQSFDLHSPGMAKQQKRLLAANTQLLAALGRLGVNDRDITTIRQVLDPYLLPISRFVVLVNEKGARLLRTQAAKSRLREREGVAQIEHVNANPGVVNE